MRKGWVKPVVKGAHVYSGLMSDLYHAFDAEFRRQGLALGAAEYRFPGLVDIETLRRAGYLASFPHQVNFLCHLPEEREAIERFQASVLSEDGLQATLPDCSMAPPSEAMSPAVCYHFTNATRGRCCLRVGSRRQPYHPAIASKENRRPVCAGSASSPCARSSSSGRRTRLPPPARG